MAKTKTKKKTIEKKFHSKGEIKIPDKKALGKIFVNHTYVTEFNKILII